VREVGLGDFCWKRDCDVLICVYKSMYGEGWLLCGKWP